MNKFIPAPGKYGGTEIMVNKFNDYIYPDLKYLTDYNMIVVPGIVPDLFTILSNKNIFWLHNTPNQYEPSFRNLILHPLVVEKILCVVVPSEYAKNTWVNGGIPAEKIKVIHNALPDFPDYEKKPNQVIRLVYTSNPSRGLELLLKATELFDFPFELDIFGYFRPGEINFHEQQQDILWVKKLKHYEQMNFYGSSTYKTIYKHVANSDFMIYPATFLETFCLSATEALALGSEVITTDCGALREILGESSTYIEYDKKFKDYVESELGGYLEPFYTKFPKTFQEVISNLANTVNETIKKPKSATEKEIISKEIQAKYNWERIKKDWLQLDQEIGNNGR